LNNVGTGDLAAPLVGNVVSLDRSKNLTFGAANGTFILFDLKINRIPEWRIIVGTTDTLQCSRFMQLGFSTCHPRTCRLFAIKCLSLLVDDLTLDLEPDLSTVGW
jgi:hypothetical protein